MKGRDSGMPQDDYWSSFFNAECIIEKMFGEDSYSGDIVEFGSGYGTFTFPAAKYTKGTLFTLDIEVDLIEQLRKNSKELAIDNIDAKVRDFVSYGTGLDSQTQSHAMIYNLLHLENPVELLKEAYRVLQPGGKLSVIHWRSDIQTPRGPILDIRPRPEQCKEWMESVGFHLIQDVDLSKCCKFHFGLLATR